MSRSHCIFCRIVDGQAPAHRIDEDERALAFLDINPVGPGHTLVIPKSHADDIWSIAPEDIDAVWRMVHALARALRRAFAPEGLQLRQANGRLGGQDVFHYHAHLLPRYAAGRNELPSGFDEVAERLRAALRDQAPTDA